LVTVGLATKNFQSLKFNDQKISLVAKLVIKIRFWSLNVTRAIQVLNKCFLMSILMDVNVRPNEKWLHYVSFNNLGERMKEARDNIP
jgi:hypothetical protein